MFDWLSSRLSRGSATVAAYTGRLQHSVRGIDLRTFASGLQTSAAEKFGFRATLACATLFLIFACIFAWSGNYFVGLMLNDFFLLSEIAYRYAFGEVPGYDFTNPMGIFAFAPQAVVYWLTGDLVLGAIVAQIFYGLVIFGFAAYVSATRLNLAVGIALTATLSLLMLAPWVLGSSFSSPYAAQSTTAMVYNRFGFIAVTLAALLATTPRDDRRQMAAWFDAPMAGVLAVLAYYSKVPFGLAVICLITFWKLWVDYAPSFLVRFAASIVIVLAAFEIAAPGLNLGYLSEQAFAGSVAGVVNLRGILRAGLYTLPELIPAAILPLALLAMHGAASWRVQVYFACLIVGTLGLLTVSAQGLALVTPIAVGAYALTALMSRPDRETVRIAVLAAGLGFATSIAEYAPKAVTTILQHARDAATATPIEGLPEAYGRLRVPRINDLAQLNSVMREAGSPAAAYRQARAHPPLNTQHAAFPDEYLATLVDLVRAKTLCGKHAMNTAVTDFTNPAPSMLGHPPVGAYAYLHYGRSFSHERHLEAGKLFRGVNCIFDPKLPIEAEARDAIWDIYGAYLKSNFTEAGSSTYWNVYVRRDPR